jgi:hypothetical protein
MSRLAWNNNDEGLDEKAALKKGAEDGGSFVAQKKKRDLREGKNLVNFPGYVANHIQ